MNIAQISDLHITGTGLTCGVAPMAENLARVVAHINAQGADIVLVSGDICHNGLPAEAARAAGILAGLTAPYIITPGNHDTRAALRASFPPAVLPATEADHLSYVVEAGGLRFIALDSTDPDTPNGRICPARAAWLAARLAESDLPTMLFMHHPPMKCGLEETDSPPLEGAGRLGAVVAQHPQILRILCGHIHVPVQALWQGRLVCAAPSMGMRLSWTPQRLVPSRFFASAPAYLWHMHNADGSMVTHAFSLDAPDGPFDFC